MLSFFRPLQNKVSKTEAHQSPPIEVIELLKEPSEEAYIQRLQKPYRTEKYRILSEVLQTKSPIITLNP